MSEAWSAPGSHAVQFYEDTRFLHRAIARFFTEATRPGDPLILVSRRSTFAAVTGELSSGRHGAAGDAADRVQFIDAEAILSQIMAGATLDSAHAEALFKDALTGVRPSRADGSIRFYGEAVDLLCQRGQHAAALQFEELASVLIDLKPELSILCGYGMTRFADDTEATRLRAVCQKHTHVIPAESSTNAPDERTRHQHAVLLQHSVVAPRHATQTAARMRTSGGTTLAPTVYVIDDDLGLRRSLGRLFTSFHWPVRIFESAEAFLVELDGLPSGCLLVDVELPGMSGLELLRRLSEARLAWPIIVMSGSPGTSIKRDALKLGARAYLQKPIDAELLLDTIARAFS